MSDTPLHLNNLFSLQTQYDKILSKYNLTAREYQNELNSLRNKNEKYDRIQRYLSSLGKTDTIKELQATESTTAPANMKSLGYLDSQYESDITDILANLRDQEGLLVLLQGKRFVGTNVAGYEFVSNATECIDLCNKTNECTGATFKGNENGGVCYINEGAGEIQPDPNSTAIVNKLQVFLNMIYDYNKQLMDINYQIQTAITDERSTNQDSLDLGNSLTNKELEQRNSQLMKQRNVINELFQQYDTNNYGLRDTNLSVTQRFYKYRLWIVLLITSILVSIYFIYGLSGLYKILPVIFVFATWLIGFPYLTFILLVVSLFYLLYKYVPTM